MEGFDIFAVSVELMNWKGCGGGQRETERGVFYLMMLSFIII